MKDLEFQVVDNLSALIKSKMQLLSREQKYPSADVDTMEDELKLLKKQVIGLLRLRTEFEILMTDIVGIEATFE